MRQIIVARAQMSTWNVIYWAQSALLRTGVQLQHINANMDMARFACHDCKRIFTHMDGFVLSMDDIDGWKLTKCYSIMSYCPATISVAGQFHHINADKAPFTLAEIMLATCWQPMVAGDCPHIALRRQWSPVRCQYIASVLPSSPNVAKAWQLFQTV